MEENKLQKLWLYSILIILKASFVFSENQTYNLRLQLNKNYGTIINERTAQEIKQKGKFGIGTRKDIVLTIFLAKKKKYVLSVKIPISKKTNNIVWKLNYNKTKINVLYTKYIQSLNSGALNVNIKINKERPYLYRKTVIYTLEFNIKKAGLYKIRLNIKTGDNYERIPVNLLIKPENLTIPSIQSIMLNYFNALKKINNILVNRKINSRYSYLERLKINRYLKDLKIINKQISFLTETERTIFRRKIFNHPQTKMFISNIKRLYRDIH